MGLGGGRQLQVLALDIQALECSNYKQSSEVNIVIDRNILHHG